MSRHPTLKWVALALVGLLIAAAIAVAGSGLVSRQIGLASEPIRAGDALAPRTSPKPAGPTDTDPTTHPGEPQQGRPSDSEETPPEASEPPETSDGDSDDD